jgi:hypothetical protein
LKSHVQNSTAQIESDLNSKGEMLMTGKKVAVFGIPRELQRKTPRVLWRVRPSELRSASGGAAEALLGAKQQGKTGFIGFTGHKDPSIHLKMLSRGFPFDTMRGR